MSNPFSIKKFPKPAFRRNFIPVYPQEEFEEDWEKDERFAEMERKRDVLAAEHNALVQEFFDRSKDLDNQLNIARRSFEIKARTIERLRRLIRELESRSVAIPTIEDEIASMRANVVSNLQSMESDIHHFDNRILEAKGKFYRDEVVRRIKERGPQ